VLHERSRSPLSEAACRCSREGARTPTMGAADVPSRMGLRALVSSQNEPGCLDPPHPVSSLAHDRGTTVHDRSPHTCLRLEHPFSREGVIPFPGLGGNAAASISAARFSVGCVEQTHLDLHDLAPSSARREHDAPNRMLQSTNRNVPSRVARCARFGRAGPRRRIRRAPRR
jgi:hypothetical protein